MSIIPIKYQSVWLQSMQENTVNTGPNIIQNGKFDSDLSSWGPVNYVWSAGTAAYDWSAGCYIGQIEQVVPLQAGKRYRLRFKYKATKEFNINLKIRDVDTYIDLVPEQTFPANDNGNWHYYTIFINCMANVDALIQFFNNTTVDGVDVSCDPEGNEDGFFLDDVTLYEQTKSYSCGACDEVIMDFNRPVEFQVKVDPSMLENLLQLSTNPYPKVTSNDLSFEMLTAATSGKYFVLYLSTQVLIFLRETSLAETNTGNIWIISCGTGSLSLFIARVKNFLQTKIDPLIGTTTTESGGIITIANVPDSSYVDDNQYSILSNITTVNAGENPDMVLINSYYNVETNQLCYFPINIAETKYIVQKTITLTTGNKYRFLFDINSDFTNFTGVVKIDDGVNPVQTLPISISYGINNVFVQFKALSTGDHDIRIEITDSNGNNTGLCLDITSFVLITFNQEDFIDKIEAKDCQGNITELPFTGLLYNDNMLIQINNSDFPISTPYRIIVTDTDGNVFISQIIRLIDFDTYSWCKRSKLLKLTWTDSCMFGDIDYVNLPFVNELYIIGFIQKAALDKKNRIQTTDANTGRSSTIYNRSVTKYELRTGLYSPATHEVLERAFEHRILSVDDELYYMDDSGNYTVNPIGNGYYNARVDLVKSGGELITGSCCS